MAHAGLLGHVTGFMRPQSPVPGPNVTQRLFALTDKVTSLLQGSRLMREQLFTLTRSQRDDLWRRYKQTSDRRVAERLHAILLLDEIR
jgi:hypothetical protein